MSHPRSPGKIARFLLAPLRLATGWGRPPRMLGTIGVLMILLLRLCVGFHFYTEGVDKMSGDFDAGRFFSAARGPFASSFKRTVWDWDGTIRLDQDRTLNFWRLYRIRIGQHYGFDKDQRRQVDLAFLRAKEQLDWILKSNAQEIEEFKLGRERIARLEEDLVRDGVDSLGSQRESIRQEWQRSIAPVLVQIDKVWTSFEGEANAVANEQQKAAGTFKLGKPRDVIIDTSVINPWIPYFDLVLGVCLILGLFTPVAALIAAGFLGSVFMSQFPPESGPGSTYYQMVEAAACLVLAGTGAGRFAGLDFIFYAVAARLWPNHPEQVTTDG